MNEYQILSSIYKLLSDSSEDVLKRIENTGKQPYEILNIVRSLRKARALMDDKSGGPRLLERKNSGKSSSEINSGFSEKDWSLNTRNLWDNLRRIISSSKKSKITNKRLLQAFIDSGIKTNARPKEGREKMLIEIQAALNKIDNTKRVKILQKVMVALGLDQTRGYIEAIKSENRH